MMAIPGCHGQIRSEETDGFVWSKTWEGKYAVAYDEYGNEIIPASKGFKYINYQPNDEGETFGYFRVQKGSKYGAYDIYGNEILPPVSKYPFRGAFTVKTADGKKGVCALTPGGDILIPAERGYTEISRREGPLYTAYYQVKRGKLMGACDIQGTEVVPPEYKYVYYSERDWCFIAQQGKKYLHLDLALDAEGNVCPKSVRDSINSNISVEDLFARALALPDSELKKKEECYRTVIALDANNGKGYKALAYNNIGAIREAQDMPKYAVTYYELALQADPSFTLAAENLVRAKAAAREKKWNSVINTLETVADVLTTAGNMAAAISGGGSTAAASAVAPTGSANAGSGGHGQGVDELEARAAKAKEDARLTPLKNRESNVYLDYAGQLSAMKTFPERYDDQQRRSIQQKMKQIRTKWEEKGFRMYHSEWEDWNGR